MMPRSTQGVEAEFGGFDNLQMLVVGDADSMHPEHAVEFFQLLGGGKKDGGWDNSGISNAPGHFARSDALQHLLFACAAADGHAVSGCADAANQVKKYKFGVSILQDVVRRMNRAEELAPVQKR